MVVVVVVPSLPLCDREELGELGVQGVQGVLIDGRWYSGGCFLRPGPTRDIDRTGWDFNWPLRLRGQRF